MSLTGLIGNELVFDNVFSGVSSGSPTVTPDSSQSQQWNTTSSNTRGSASTKQATGTSVTMSWT